MRSTIVTLLLFVVCCGCSGQTPAPPIAERANNPDGAEQDKEADAVKLVENLGGEFLQKVPVKRIQA